MAILVLFLILSTIRILLNFKTRHLWNLIDTLQMLSFLRYTQLTLPTQMVTCFEAFDGTRLSRYIGAILCNFLESYLGTYETSTVNNGFGDKVDSFFMMNNGLVITGLFIMLNTATSLISDVIGKDTANSAFVYGCYSLFDKFANGFLMYYMIAEYSEDATALRYINAITPCLSSALAGVLAYLGNRWYDHKLAKLSGIN